MDSLRSTTFTKHARNITVAARQGGGDPAYNAALKLAIDKAKADNMPNDNINRAIKKGIGATDGEKYEHITYEGNGPGGVALIIECLTDNKNRTAGDLRHYFDKCGGNLGQTGCVSFLFNDKGVIVIDNEDEELDEDDVMMEVLDAGADDFEPDGETFVVYTAPDDVSPVAEKISAAGYKLLSAQVEMLPQNGYIKLTNEDDIKNMQKMLDMFEDNDDVQNVWHNWEE